MLTLLEEEKEIRSSLFQDREGCVESRYRLVSKKEHNITRDPVSLLL